VTPNDQRIDIFLCELWVPGFKPVHCGSGFKKH